MTGDARGRDPSAAQDAAGGRGRRTSSQGSEDSARRDAGEPPSDLESPHCTAGTTLEPALGDTRNIILAALKKNVVRTEEDQYHNPDPLARLIGEQNEGVVCVDGAPVTALLDTGAQITTVSDKWCVENGKTIYPLDKALNLRGAGNNVIPHKGVVEAELTVPHAPEYKEKTLLLVVGHCPYHDRVPLILGTMQLRNIIRTQKQGQPLTEAWELVSLASEMANQPRQKDANFFDLRTVQGNVKLAKDLRIPPGSTARGKGTTPVTVHSCRIHVMTGDEELEEGRLWQPVPTYTELKAHSGKVDVILENTSTHPIVVKKGTVVGGVHAANILPALIAQQRPDPTVPLPKEDVEGKPTPIPKRHLSPEQREKFLSQFDLTGLESWEASLAKEASEILCEMENVFSRDELDMGKTELLKHDIVLTDPTPFRERYRRIPPHIYEEVREHLMDMLRVGAIQRSNSPWASAVVLARKKNGKLRFCIDLRKLNNRTVKDAYSLPRIEETLDCLRGAMLFSALDLKAGYWQVEMTERAKPYTAFTVGPLGFFECNRMPFGLTNAPATFQRLMQSCLGELHLQCCLVYLDDVVVFSRTPREHLDSLKKVLQKLEACGLKLRPEKCSLFRVKLDFLGHVVSGGGVGASEGRIEAVKNWTTPRTIADLRRFLGFASYYRKFIKNFAQTARPLHRLTGNTSKREGQKTEIPWGPEQQSAFDALKVAITEAPVLAYPDFTKPFLVKTDASQSGLGAVLYQDHGEEGIRPVCFASRSVSASEAKYPAYKLEFLGLVWSVTRKFREYLYGGTFTVYTDSNPLTYVQTTARLDAMTQRWVAELASFNVSLAYKPGASNVEADALSRIRWPDSPQEEERVVVSADTVQAAFAGALHVKNCIIQTEEPKQERDEICPGPTVRLCSNQEEEELDNNTLWLRRQRQDPVLGLVLKAWDLDSFGRLSQNKQADRPGPSLGGTTERKREVAGMVALRRMFEKLKIEEQDEYRQLLRIKPQLMRRNGLLYREKKISGRKALQMVLPRTFRTLILRRAHDSMGHLGRDRVLSVLEERTFWPGMRRDVEDHLATCDRCLRFKAVPDVAPLQPIVATHPLEVVHLDFLKVEGANDEYRNVLVITDHFTGFAQAYVTPNESAKATARTFVEEFCHSYGVPDRIITDQGRNFESKLLRETCDLLGVEKSRTTAYHPQTNGQCERFNRTLLAMLGTLDPADKTRWSKKLKALVWSYNATRHRVTGFSPHFLFFGWSPRLPVDVELGLPQPRGWQKEGTKSKWLQDHRRQMAWATEVARRARESESRRSKQRYDVKVRGYTLHPGDLCLVRKRKFEGKHKIADRWEPGTYTVVTRAKGALVYEVEPVDGGPRLKLHRNHLLPLAGRVRGRAQFAVNTPDEREGSAVDETAGGGVFRDARDLPPDPDDQVTKSGTSNAPPDVQVHSESEESSYEDAQEEPEPQPPLRRSRRTVRPPKRYQQAVFVSMKEARDWPSVDVECDGDVIPHQLEDVFPRLEPRRLCTIVPRHGSMLRPDGGATFLD